MGLKTDLKAAGILLSLSQVADGGYHTIQWWARMRMVTSQAVRLWIKEGKFEAALCEGRIFCKPKGEKNALGQ